MIIITLVVVVATAIAAAAVAAVVEVALQSTRLALHSTHHHVMPATHHLEAWLSRASKARCQLLSVVQVVCDPGLCLAQ